MHKKLLAMIFAALLALGAAACDGGNGTADDPAAEDPAVEEPMDEGTS